MRSLKVNRIPKVNVRFPIGFAAGCEEGLCPAGALDQNKRATPLVRAMPDVHGPEATPGAEPQFFFKLYRRGGSLASHRAAKPL